MALTSRLHLLLTIFIITAIQASSAVPFPPSEHRRDHTCAHNASACWAMSPNHACCFNRACKDLSTNPFNCGACGRACPMGQRCCGGECVDLSTDANHCSKCSLSCLPGVLCSSGMCGYA
ncbi:hypothetical protein QJS04_geneDACA009816 [Acorus gramineus]|uniref:Stigma-specific Stig1 family protein n=1 Tax=Acorus gramineus TaxID=55184 RepID=A0AAV9BB43_ACOGR|nr:hypothetical protein QJS04_geneDACA009816 [Acorus gramineus]